MWCWPALVKTGVCTADFGINLVTFSPREKPGCVILHLSRPLLHRYEPCWFSPLPWLQHWAIWKRCFYTWVATSINSNIITLSLLLLLFFFTLSVHKPCALFFGKLILLKWCVCHEFSPSPLGFLAWPSSFFPCVLYQVVSPGCPTSRTLALTRPSVSVSLTLLILPSFLVLISFEHSAINLLLQGQACFKALLLSMLSNKKEYYV